MIQREFNSDSERDKRIRERAYQIWTEEGCPEGREDAHWEMAEELVAIEESQALATEPNPVAQEQGGVGEPVEPIEAVENQGDFPTLTDQGEERTAPKRRRRKASA